MSGKNYIDNKHFEKIIKQYLSDQKGNEDELMSLFDLLIDNIINSFNFRIEKEDAKQECFVLILKVLKNFDPAQGSAFNYFTTVIVNNLRLIYTKNKKYKEKLQEYISKKKESDF